MIQIGKIVYYLLSGDTTVAGYVGTKIYPLIIPENTTTPAIMYERRGDPDYNKDGAGLYKTYVYITIIGDNYSEIINITQAVADVLENYSGILYSTSVRDIEIANIQETYYDDKYIEELTFLFTTN